VSLFQGRNDDNFLALFNRRAVDADLVKYLLNCGTCTLDYMQEDLSGGVPGTYGAGLQHTFTQDGNDVAETRDFFFQAEVTPGEILSSAS
jgi:hypothetical protein